MPLPKEWSPLRRRQFEHVRESLLEQGRTWEKATEIAARTVNKQRREAGEATSPRPARRPTRRDDR